MMTHLCCLSAQLPHLSPLLLLCTLLPLLLLTGLPLTDAELGGAYAVLSGHDPAAVDWAAFALVPTLVILMGGRALPRIVTQLTATGWASDTPVRAQ